jgi:hypothetical protein
MRHSMTTTDAEKLCASAMRRNLCGNGAQPPPVNVSYVEVSRGRINLGKVNQVTRSERVVDLLTEVAESIHRDVRGSV